MNCQDAQYHTLAGGPLPAEAQAHIRACPGCTQELSALRSIESRLAGAAPPPELPSGLEHRVMARLRPRRLLSWAGVPAAAALLLASALLTAWLYWAPLPHPQTSILPSGVSAELPPLEDSTASLLQACEPIAAQLPTVQPEEMEGYLAPTEQGGWNG